MAVGDMPHTGTCPGSKLPMFVTIFPFLPPPGNKGKTVIICLLRKKYCASAFKLFFDGAQIFFLPKLYRDVSRLRIFTQSAFEAYICHFHCMNGKLSSPCDIFVGCVRFRYNMHRMGFLSCYYFCPFSLCACIDI